MKQKMLGGVTKENRKKSDKKSQSQTKQKDKRQKTPFW